VNLPGLALRNLRRRPMRSALSIVGIALAVGSAIALMALSHSIEQSTQESLAERGADFTVTQRGASDMFGGFVPEELEDRLRAIPGVARVAGELIMFAPSGDRQVLVAGWSPRSYFWAGVPLRDGRLPQAGERHVALIGDALAEALAKRLGDDIEISGETFRIVGITRYASILNRGLTIVPLADLQEVAFRQGQVTVFHIGIARGTDVDRIKQTIEDLGRVTVSMTGDLVRNDRDVAVLKAVSLAVSIIALAMGAMNVLNTMLMTIQERTREIGIVAALGWSDARIMASIVLEGLMMGAAGCVLGVGLGCLASLLLAAIPTVGRYLSFTPTAALVVPTVVAAVALCAAGSLYPAWRATRLTPAQALQRA
jgi:putative ABC transport system permease protein